MTGVRIKRAQPFDARLVAPPSKYHTHRALILASLAEGTSSISGTSESLDNLSTLRCLELFGTRFARNQEGYLVHGGPYNTPEEILDVGNSGSTLHFLMGVGSSAKGTVVFTGDESLRKRPLEPYLDALNRWGIEAWSTRGNGRPPVVVKHRDPTGLASEIKVDGLISQWTTGLVLHAPLTGHDVAVHVKGKIQEPSYVEMTTAMMRQFGVIVKTSPNRRSYFIQGGQKYVPAQVTIPGDIALASFGLALAVLTGSHLIYENIHLEVVHPEGAFVRALEEMGASLKIDRQAGTIESSREKQLDGITFDCGDAPDMVPILSVLLALARGTSRITNAAQLRYKESNRLQAMCQLNRMGANVQETEDGLLFQGVDRLHGATLDAMHDHRVAMSLIVAGCVADGTTEVIGAESASVSYPGFLRDLRSIGVDVKEYHSGGPE